MFAWHLKPRSLSSDHASATSEVNGDCPHAAMPEPNKPLSPNRPVWHGPLNEKIVQSLEQKADSALLRAAHLFAESHQKREEALAISSQFMAMAAQVNNHAAFVAHQSPLHAKHGTVYEHQHHDPRSHTVMGRENRGHVTQSGANHHDMDDDHEQHSEDDVAATLRHEAEYNAIVHSVQDSEQALEALKTRYTAAQAECVRLEREANAVSADAEIMFGRAQQARAAWEQKVAEQANHDQNQPQPQAPLEK